MRRWKSPDALKYLGIAAVAAVITAFFFQHREVAHNPSLPSIASQQAGPAEKKATGYKEEDRRKLEQLIHEGSKDD